MEKVKVGVIGTGFIGPAHIEALRRLGNIEVAALAECSQDVAKSKAELLNVERYDGDYKQLLKNRDIQSVHICSPNYLHYEMAKEALEAGKHVICEKPLAISVPEAEELVDLAGKKGLINVVNFNIRYYPLMRQVKVMVEKGDVGDILAVQSISRLCRPISDPWGLFEIYLKSFFVRRCAKLGGLPGNLHRSA